MSQGKWKLQHHTVVLLILALAAGVPVRGAQSAAPARRPAEISGQDLFRMLFFGQGKAAELFPGFWSPAARKSAVEAVLREPPDVSATVQALDRLRNRARAQGKTDYSVALRKASQTLVRFRKEVSGLSADAVTSDQAFGRTRTDLINAVVAAIQTRDPKFFPQFRRKILSGKHVMVASGLEDGTTQLVLTLNQLGLFDPPAPNTDALDLSVKVKNKVAAVNYVLAANIAVLFHVVLLNAQVVPILRAESQDQLARDLYVDAIVEQLGPQAGGRR